MSNDTKNIFRHSVIYGVSNISQKAVGFLMIPIYTRYLTTADYGTIQLLELLTTIAALIVTFAMNSAIFRFYYQYEKEKDRNEVISTAYLFILAVTLPTMIFVYLFSSKISSLVFGDASFSSYICIIFTTFFINQQETVFFTYLLATKRAVLYTVFSIFQLIISLSLNIYFVVFLKKGVIGILYSGLIHHFLLLLIVGSFSLYRTKVRYSYEKLKEMIIYGLPLLPSSLGMFIITSSSRFFLTKFSSLSEVGIFSLGYNFGFMISFLIIQPFMNSWQAHAFEIAKKDNGREIFSKILTYFTFIIVFFAVSLSIFGKDLMKIVATPSFYDAYKVIPFITFAYVMLGLYYNFYIGFLIEKKTKYIGMIVSVTAAANILLNLLIIPQFGMYGAAIATFISFLLMALGALLISKRIYDIKYEFTRLIKIFASAAAIYIFSTNISVNSILLSSCLNAILILSFPIILFFMKFYKNDELVLAKRLIQRNLFKINEWCFLRK